MTIKTFLCLFIFLTSIPFISAEEEASEYQLNLIYDGKNLSFGNLSREVPFGVYRVELISLSGKVIETSEFPIINNLSQTFKVFVPYSKEGILLNIYHPNGTLIFHANVSQYARPELKTPDKYQLNFTYDGKNFKSVELSVISPDARLNFIYDEKNLSSVDYSREAPFGGYKVELVSLRGETVEASEFSIINNFSQTFKVVIPYSKDGAFLKVSYPDDTLMLGINVSQYAELESTSIPLVFGTPNKYRLNFTYDRENFKSVELSVIFPESQLNFIYDEKNLSSSINYSTGAPFGSYKVELISFNGTTIEASEFSINDNLPQTINILIPYSENGTFIKVSYPDNTIMFGIDVSQYAGSEYQNISKNISKEVMQNLTNAKTNETYLKQYEEKYQTSKKWFTRLIIACVVIVVIILLYVWRYKMAR